MSAQAQLAGTMTARCKTSGDCVDDAGTTWLFHVPDWARALKCEGRCVCDEFREAQGAGCDLPLTFGESAPGEGA